MPIIFPIFTDSGSANDSTSDFVSKLLIAPRELIRFVEEKHQVLVIDYREDQSTMLKYDKCDRILVAHVPANAIVPG